VKFLTLPEVDCSIPWRETGNPDDEDELSDEVDESNVQLDITRTESLFSTNKVDSSINVRQSCQYTDRDGVCCTISDGYFAWVVNEKNEKIPILNNINIWIPKEKLTLIVGSVGSGKSSLLSAIIGEMVKISGHISWSETNSFIGYVGESPWLINSSLQENITFGYPFDRKRYDKVIKACALQADIDILPNGDFTEIGERGINLSGGQKERIALARAIYSPANTLVLDDTLSALDPIVGSHVFEHAIKVNISILFDICLKKKEKKIFIQNP